MQQIGRMMQTELAKAFLAGSFIHEIRSGTRIIPPPAPRKPFISPVSMPDKTYLNKKTPPLRRYFLLFMLLLFKNGFYCIGNKIDNIAWQHAVFAKLLPGDCRCHLMNIYAGSCCVGWDAALS